MKNTLNFVSVNRFALFVLLGLLFASCRKSDLLTDPLPIIGTNPLTPTSSPPPADSSSPSPSPSPTPSPTPSSTTMSSPNLVFEETVEGDKPFSQARSWEVGTWDYALQFTSPAFQGQKSARFEIRQD